MASVPSALESVAEQRAEGCGGKNLRFVRPFACRMWRGHGRLAELITEQSCQDEIKSFVRHGQKHPVLGRPLKGDSRYQIELIYGARRLFAAQHLNVDLLVEVRELDDAQAFVEMDIENRLRRDWSPYERGTAYKDWIRNGYFRSQRELAAAFGLSEAHVSRLLRFAELPSVVTSSFRDLTKIKESWAVALAERCKDPEVRHKMTCVARRLQANKEEFEPATTMRLLLACEDRKQRDRRTCRDTIVRSKQGEALFWISYRSKDLHIVVPRDHVSTQMLEDLTNVLKDLIDTDTNGEPEQGRRRDSPHAAPLQIANRTLSDVRPQPDARHDRSHLQAVPDRKVAASAVDGA